MPSRLRDREQPARGVRGPVLGIVALCAVLAGYIAWQPQGVFVANTVDDIAEAATALLAAVASALAARRSGGSVAKAWALLAVGTGAWAAGQVLTCWYEIGRDVDPPYPGLCDIGFLTFAPCAIAALWLFARGGNALGWQRAVLDGLILVGSLVVLTWTTALGAVWQSRSGSTLADSVSIAYPATDVAIAATALLSVPYASWRYRSTLRLLALALVGMAVSDSAFNWLMTLPEFGRWQALDAGWPLAFLIMALAARTAGSSARGPRDRARPGQQSWFDLALPYVPVLPALAVWFGKALVGHRVDAAAFIAGGLTLLCVLARQFLVLAENRRLVAAVAHQALHDSLTGLANRALFLDRLAHANTLRERSGQPFGVLFMDVDNFKEINDGLGHPAGDELLVLVAERLCSCVGPADTVARLGGDEFAVLLEVSVHDPAAIAAEMRRAMEEPFTINGHSVRSSLSIGLAVADDVDLETSEYLRRADVAMYAAKAAGKNAVRTYAPNLDDAVTVGAGRRR